MLGFSHFPEPGVKGDGRPGALSELSEIAVHPSVAVLERNIERVSSRSRRSSRCSASSGIRSPRTTRDATRCRRRAEGRLILMADLSRHIRLPVEVDFMAVASYGAATKTSGVVRILKDLDHDLEGREVLLVEDIVDSGLTLNYLLKNLRGRRPASLEVCALLKKTGIQRVHLDVKYVGFEIPPDFVVCYGLDFAEKYRNLPYIDLAPRGVPRRPLDTSGLLACSGAVLASPRARCVFAHLGLRSIPAPRRAERSPAGRA
jgi:hypoxanthine phosphoribosyltransferase